ncbi:MAG: response regulator [Xanthomonadales bacterium]|nr:response regulator [Gammaproteobacteria bacterium]MBT8052368.1 response regulator [Gammaproteobacteria bacterium]NND56522.1 response regulator [Xanthomonadales bacterium]NNK52579.1 response regulator [Xanthomonadales bacterium]
MANVLKTIIVDDEALARRGLNVRLAGRDDVDVIAEARNGREALELIRQHAPDLVFLDIQMPGVDGFDVLRALNVKSMPAIVFVTAFDDYAIKAFEANALDYLLKPIEDSRLAEALDRVHENLDRRQAKEHRKSLLKLVGEITGESIGSMEELKAKRVERLKKKEVAKLAIKDGSRTTWVPQDKIEWIDAAGDYMCVHSGGETYIMRMTMKKLESVLDPDHLQRIHRSTIVNIHQVKEMQAHINGEYFLTLAGGHTVKMSRTYKDKLDLFT